MVSRRTGHRNLVERWGLADTLGITKWVETMWDGFNVIVRLASADQGRRLAPDLAVIARLPCAGAIVTAGRRT